MNVRKVANVGCGANMERMILVGEGSVEQAQAEVMSEGYFEGTKIALGSLYIDANSFAKSIYNETNNVWTTQE